MALVSGIEEAKILEIKQAEIHDKVSSSIRKRGWLPSLFRRIVNKTKEFYKTLSVNMRCRRSSPKGRASETGSGSCRSHARNPLTETADRQRKTAAMVLPIHGGIHIEISFPVSL